MPEAVEWFQCDRCGRRQRWIAELAGKQIPCRCGAMITCPQGLAANGGAGASESFSDTIIEAADSPSVRAPYEALDPEIFEPGGELSLPPTIEEVKASRAFFIWTFGMLFGLSMLIHAIITQWRIYIIIAALVVPITFWKFFTTKRRWQRGRSFSAALARSLGMDRG